MAAIETAAAPPNQGRINFAIMGCIGKDRSTLRNIVRTKQEHEER
jgi:hypothetical protein